MSEDHKPENPAESQSIRDKGGFVTENSRVRITILDNATRGWVGADVSSSPPFQQVCGILALSRALGDCELQECITWMPEVRYVLTTLHPHH
jgi:serine/threonine protein phosphatase PrpC